MVSGDFCHHDWPGSGCPECREETRVRSIARAEASEARATALEAQLANRISEAHEWLLVEALSEIKATVDSESEQPVKEIVYGVLAEIKALPALRSTAPADGRGDVERQQRAEERALGGKMMRRHPPTEAREDGVKVKALEWQVYPDDGSFVQEGQGRKRDYRERALHSYGAYFLMEKAGRFSIRDSTDGHQEEPDFGNPEAARGSASERHEARIRSALTAPDSSTQIGKEE